MRTTRTTLYLLSGALLLAPLSAGCELIPGLLGGPQPTPISQRGLTVSIDSAEGELGGQPLSVEALEAHGNLQPAGVDLHLRIGHEVTLGVFSQTPNNGSSDNPYGGAGDSFFGDDSGLPEDAGPGSLPSSNLSTGLSPDVVLCGAAPECREPDKLEVHSYERGGERHMVLEGEWDSGDRASIELHYYGAE